MPPLDTALPDAAAGPPGIDDLLDWPGDCLPTLTTLLALRRRWFASDFAALRRQYEAATAGSAPGTQVEAEPIIPALPAAAGFKWMHRHIQDRTWALCERIAAARAEEISAALTPAPGDLGTLEGTEGFQYPAPTTRSTITGR